MIKNFKKGFTLIELLVVIAIIGILSSIVLASLSSARAKGTDAAIKADLSNMRAQAELYFSNNSNYGGVTTAVATTTACTGGTANATTTKALFDVSTANGGLGDMITALRTKTTGNVAFCSAPLGGTSWAVSAPISTGNWCVDSTGKSASGYASLNTGVCI